MKKPGYAFVTGGTSGIGKALVYKLASEGVNLIVSGRNQFALDELVQNLSSKISIKTFQGDLGDPIKRAELISFMKQEQPDLIVNNAGFGVYGEAIEQSIPMQSEVIEVNVQALTEICLEAGKMLKEAKKEGIILNVSSAAAFYEMPLFAVYAASKAFVNNFSLALDWELSSFGIRVLTICPGQVETQFFDRLQGVKPKIRSGIMTSNFLAEEIWQQILERNPLRIVDYKMRIAHFISRFLPSHWTKSLIGTIARRDNREFSKNLSKKD